MKFQKLTTLLLENEVVPNMYKLGYNSPEQFTQYQQHPYNSTSMDSGDESISQPNAYPEAEEISTYNQGDIIKFIESGSNNGFYSLKTKRIYWPENKREQKLTMGAHGPLLSSIALKYDTDENQIVKTLELVKLRKNQNILLIEPTYRQLSGFDEENIINNLDTPDTIVKFESNLDLPKPNLQLIRHMYGQHF